jgi:hypothetical protein
VVNSFRMRHIADPAPQSSDEGPEGD